MLEPDIDLVMHCGIFSKSDGKYHSHFAGRSLVVLLIKIDILAM